MMKRKKTRIMKGVEMSLRKGLALILLMAMSFTMVPAEAVNVSGTTPNTLFEARVLPGTGNAATILTQANAAANGVALATKGLRATANTDDIRLIGNGTTTDFATLVSAAGTRKLYDKLAPGFVGSNQTQHFKVLVCETAANTFANNQAFFIALPDGWNINNESNGETTVTPFARVASIAVSNGLVAANASAANAGIVAPTVATNIQRRTSPNTPGGVFVKLTTASVNTTAEALAARDCFAVEIQHENIIGPTTVTGADLTATVYTVGATAAITGASTDPTFGTVPVVGNPASTDIPFVSKLLDTSAILSFPAAKDLVNDFVRTASTLPTGVENRSRAEKLAVGAIAQDIAVPTILTRYRSQAFGTNNTGTLTDIYGLLVTEPDPGAWNFIDGPSLIRPSSTLNVAYTASANNAATAKVTVSCTLDNGTALQSSILKGTPVVTAVDKDVDIETTTPAPVCARGECRFDFYARSTFTGDPNDSVTKFLVQGLSLNGTNATALASNVKCLAKASRFATTNGEVETVAGAELIYRNGGVLGANTVALPVKVDKDGNGAANGGNGSILNGYVLGAVAGLGFTTVTAEPFTADVGPYTTATGATGNAYVNNGTVANADVHNAQNFAQFSNAALTVAQTLANGTTALKEVSTATQVSVAVASLPTESTATGDKDKLVTVTVASNSLTPGIPVKLATFNPSSSGDSTSANTIVGVADNSGGAKLSIRATDAATVRLTSTGIAAAATKDISVATLAITEQFTGTITTQLDGADGFINREGAGANILVLFDASNGNTIGFDLDDVVAAGGASVNGSGNVVRLGTVVAGTTRYAALVPSGFAQALVLSADVAGATVQPNTAITVGTNFIVQSATVDLGASVGRVLVADKRSKSGQIVFRRADGKRFPSVVAASPGSIEVTDTGVIKIASVSLNKARTRVRFDNAGDDTRFVCVTARRTYCYDLES